MTPRAVKEASGVNVAGVPSSIWRVHMRRQFESLLLASEPNTQARKLCEEAFVKLKVDVGVVVSSVYVCDTKNDQQSSVSNQIIGNPQGSRKKGKRNVWRKSMLEKISSIVRSRKARFSLRNGGDILRPQVKVCSQLSE